MQGKKILVIDDDLHINQLVKATFVEQGADVVTAVDGQDGLRQFYNHKPDLVIIDLMMPEMDGWETTERILELADVPIIMLTSLRDDADVISGLDRGAIDYVTKPFSPKVLAARARAALRHASMPRPQTQNTFQDKRLLIDLDHNRVLLEGEPVKLTKTEFKVLTYLVQNAGHILTFQQILEHVWGWEYQDSIEYVHVYVSRLRQKLEEDPKEPRYLLTEYGIGYRFVK
ncbi:MAG: response regulator transcription factor [Ardenticatenaceae bacterium]|nr:response regulator transcription factor [Ardenticatenaceae bacterium]